MKDLSESLDRETLERFGKITSGYSADLKDQILIEELSELIKEVCKSHRGEDNKEAIVSEMADALLMIEQYRLIHHISDEHVLKYMYEKINRQYWRYVMEGKGE